MREYSFLGTTPLLRTYLKKLPQDATIPGSQFQPESPKAKIQTANSKRIRNKLNIRGEKRFIEWRKKSK